MSAPRSRLAVLLTAVLVALGGQVAFAPAGQAQTYAPISGSGSTAASNAVDQWRRDVDQLLGLPVQYSPSGSAVGRNDFRNELVDFAVSELEYDVVDTGVADPPPTRPFAYLPMLGGGIAFAYNLTVGGSRVTDLRLSGDTVAKIFTRVITRWDDPTILADNPGRPLPALAITPVVRADASGSTARLTGWLADRHAAVWNRFCSGIGRPVPCGPTTTYPVVPGIDARSGSQGVTGFVSQTSSAGAITYVEYSYARNAALPAVRLRNDSGAYVLPDAANVMVALEAARIRPDLTQDLAGVHRSLAPNAYPLSSYTYAIVPTAPTARFADAKGRSLAAFLHYTLCQGQTRLPIFGDAPLPPNLAQAALDQITRIPGSTQPPTCTPAPPPTASTPENITTEVLPGALTIRVADAGVTLPSPMLTSDARLLVTRGALNPVRVTDTRAGNPGWNVSAQAGDFSDGRAARINVANLGWTPRVLAASAAQAVTPGPPIPPADGVVPGTINPNTVGLGFSRTLASTPPGAGVGTADLTADLRLNAPTTTTAGTYTALLTLTVI